MAAGLTQKELAERACLSVRGISNLERGVRRLPQPGTIRLLAEALHLTGPDRATFEAATRGLSALCPTRSRPSLGSSLPPLVGRTRELAMLERHLAGEGPPVLLLAGEPGIGKTRLLQEVIQQAEGHGWTVLIGSCQRWGGQEPYAPLLEALECYIQQRAPTPLRLDLQGCAWLVRLLPELAVGPLEPLPAWTLPPEQERRLMFAVVEHFLANVAGGAGTLLVLDDLQWAGTDALDLLATLVRAATAVPLRVIGAYRNTEVAPQDLLCPTLVDLARAELAEQHTPGPLAPAEAQQLLAGLLAGVEVPATVRQRLVERTAGVPFYLVSCARGLRVGAFDAATAERLPWDLTQSR